MHERYLMMAVVLMTLATPQKGQAADVADHRGHGALLLNSGVVLDRGIRIGGSSANPSAGTGAEERFRVAGDGLVGAQPAGGGYALYLGIALTRPDEQAQLLAPAVRAAGRACLPGRLSCAERGQSALPWSGRERLFVIAAAALYAALAFVNLGSLKAPQTPWVSDSVVSQAAFDLGESRQFNLLFYGGIHQRVTGFTVETSEDGIAWSEPQRAMMKEGLCFTWFYHRPIQDTDKGPEYFGTPTKHTGRYVRLTSEGIGLTLYEVLARDAETKEALKLKALEPSSGVLCDEQNSLDGEPGWFNSMYFDEIYHGRSGFEMLNAIRGQEPSLVYENTHPQLGKLLMSFFIMIFGMVPFGWRFGGALAGVLMLPGMYLLGREMTGRRGGGMLALGLMAFDFMHFTQTRIATIDSFVTLFIIYAYLFMIRFIRLDYFALPLGKTLKPLFLSGLMMGLAISSKWTGIYAGIGLGVLFFWAMARWGSLALAAERLPEAEKAKVPGAAHNFKKRALITLLFCVLFFIVIPLIIYTVSFIPMFVAEPGGFTLKR